MKKRIKDSKNLKHSNKSRLKTKRKWIIRKKLNITKVFNSILIFLILIVVIAIIVVIQKDKKKLESGKGEINKQYISDIIKKTRVNENGKVIGIDISEKMPADRLKKLLEDENAIPNSIWDTRGVEHDISDLAGPIDYVMIKIGARGYGEEGNLIDIGNIYIEHAKVCEELEIPYGFYYYSTALTEEETKEEVEIVNKCLNKIEQKTYNLFDLTLDAEQCDESRMVGKDITDIKAKWVNLAEEMTGKKVMLYTGGKDVVGDKKILDLVRFNNQIESGPVKLWTPGPRIPDGSRVHIENQEQINEIINEIGDIEIIQAILDQNNPEKGLDEHIDIDIMDIEVFKNMIEENAKK